VTASNLSTASTYETVTYGSATTTTIADETSNDPGTPGDNDPIYLQTFVVLGSQPISGTYQTYTLGGNTVYLVKEATIYESGTPTGSANYVVLATDASGTALAAGSQPTGSTVAVTYTPAATDGAVRASDYTATTTSVNIGSTFTASVIDDSADEPNETFKISVGALSNASTYETVNYGTEVVTTIVDNDVSVAVDTYWAVEGGTLNVDAVAGILTNDQSGLAVAKAGAASDGTAAITVNGVTTFQTALGGTVTMFADGHFTYTKGAYNHAAGSDSATDSFYYQASGSDGTSGWTKVTVNLLDTHIDAQNDYKGSVVLNSTTLGNVLDNDISLDVISPTQKGVVTQVDGVTIAATGETAVVGEYGTLYMQANGAYRYEATGKSITPVDNQGAGIYGLTLAQLGDTNLGDSVHPDLIVSNLNATSAGHVGLSGGSKAGWGVDYAKNAGVVDKGEALVIALKEEYAGEVGFQIGQLNANQGGGSATWIAYDKDGNYLQQGSFSSADTSGFAQATGVFAQGAPVKYIAFSWVDNSNGFTVTAVNLKAVGNESFTYTVRDNDGDMDAATLNFTSGAAPTSPTGVEQAQLPDIKDLLHSDSDVIFGGNTNVSFNSGHQSIDFNGLTADQIKSLLNHSNTNNDGA